MPSQKLVSKAVIGAVGTMQKFYRGKVQNYVSEEIDGSGEK
jgi:hypothetical protein